ncbi:hypothetical protein TBS_22330 [Thermobispora bispora]
MAPALAGPLAPPRPFPRLHRASARRPALPPGGPRFRPAARPPEARSLFILFILIRFSAVPVPGSAARHAPIPTGPGLRDRSPAPITPPRRVRTAVAAARIPVRRPASAGEIRSCRAPRPELASG